MRSAQGGFAHAATRWGEPRHERTSRSIVKPKDVSELDVGVSVVAVVVLGQDDPGGAKDSS